VVMLASRIAVSRATAHASRRVVGQWGGAGGAIYEEHLALARCLRALRGLTRLEKPEIFISQNSQTNPYHRPRLTGVASDSSPSAARSARSAAGVIARHSN